MPYYISARQDIFHHTRFTAQRRIGALYARSVMPRVKLDPVIYGGGQEKHIRSGTLNVPVIVGFAKAVEISQDEMESENLRFRRWNKQMYGKLSSINAKLNGHPTKRLVHNLNIRFDGVDGKAIINYISKRLAISAGSACTTQTVEPSHVLRALGLTEEQAHSSIRIGYSRFNIDDEISIAVEKISSCVECLRKVHSEALL